MKLDVTTQAVIARPVAAVAAYAMDPDKAPAWYENIKSVEWQTPRPLRLGSRIAFVAHFLDKRLAYTYEIVGLESGRRLVMRTAQDPFPMETTYDFEPADSGTRMTLRNRGEPRGFGLMMAPLMAIMVRRTNRKDLARLKDILERD